MKLFQHLVSPNFRCLLNFSLKTAPKGVRRNVDQLQGKKVRSVECEKTPHKSKTCFIYFEEYFCPLKTSKPRDSFLIRGFTISESYFRNAGKAYVKKTFINTSILSSYASTAKFHNSCHVSREANGLPTSQTKKRFQRKKTLKLKEEMDKVTWTAIAYSTCEEYTMPILVQALKNQGLYQSLPLPEDASNDLHLSFKGETSDQPSHIYIFSEGSVVFWNIPEPKQKEMLSFLKPYEINSYDVALVEAEKEDLDFIYSEDETRLHDGCVILNSNENTDLYTYTFSNSLAQSVKLGILEELLEKYSNSIEWVTDKMKSGEKISMSRREIFAKRGELFSLRHVINLSSDLLDTPDFYWDRKNLEILYHQTCNYLDIPKRTRINWMSRLLGSESAGFYYTMNVRLNYCSELVDLLGNHMNDEHHVRLEWMIIILIMVEVVFECIHFLEKFSH